MAEKHRLIQLEGRLKSGLGEEYAHWAARARELAFYQMENAQLILPRDGEAPGDFAARPKVTSNVTYQVVNTLGSGLYNPGPFRQIRNGAAEDALYQKVLQSNDADAKLRRGDELSTLHGGYALQVAPSDDPARPLKLYPWMATEFYPYPRDDDPSDVWAVLVQSVYPMRRQVRFQLWDDREVRTYWTRPGDCEPKPNGDGREYEFDAAGSGPHGFGCLPFVFLHAAAPVSGFWEGALGGPLTRLNATVDVKLSDLAESIQKFTCPRMYSKNLSSERTYSNIPGVAAELLERDPATPADIFFRQPTLQVEQVWADVDNLLDRTFLELNIPLQAKATDVRPESGVALAMKRIDLIQRTTGRQPLWAGYERQLARVILRAAAVLVEGCEGFGAAADALDLEVTYPAPSLPLPSPERDSQDKFLLELGAKSRLQIIQERRGGTREQAIAALRQVEEDRRLEAEILAGADPIGPADDLPAPAPAATAEAEAALAKA